MFEALKSQRRIIGTQVSEIPSTLEKFNKENLPLHKQMIGMVRIICEDGGVAYDKAVSDITVIIREHWKHDREQLHLND